MGDSTSNEQKQGLHCLAPSIQGPNGQKIGLLGWAQVASPMETCRTWKAKQVISEKIVNYVYKEEFD